MATAVIQAAAQLLLDAAMRVIYEDPRQWSTRSCATCRTVTGIVGKPFGCDLYRPDKTKREEKRA